MPAFTFARKPKGGFGTPYFLHLLAIRYANSLATSTVGMVHTSLINSRFETGRFPQSGGSIVVFLVIVQGLYNSLVITQGALAFASKTNGWQLFLSKCPLY